MIHKKEELLATMSAANMKKVLELGVEFHDGRGVLLDAHTIQITQQSTQKSHKITSKFIILNMGCYSAGLPGNIIPIDHKRIITSNDAINNLHFLPKSMVVIGGGFIGIELGSHFCKLGCDVTIVDFADSILTTLDKELQREMLEILKLQGLKFELARKVTSGYLTLYFITICDSFII